VSAKRLQDGKPVHDSLKSPLPKISAYKRVEGDINVQQDAPNDHKMTHPQQMVDL
jgi:hypothetical protein